MKKTLVGLTIAGALALGVTSASAGSMWNPVATQEGAVVQYEEATLQQILAQKLPMVEVYTVVAKEDSSDGVIYELEGLNDQSDAFNHPLDGTYEIGEIVLITYNHEDEIVSDVRIADSSELDKRWVKTGGGN